MADTLLPDSRLRKPKRTVIGTVGGVRVEWEQVFCANCGAEGPLCPVENTTFMFYLCNPCHETHGDVAGTLAVPDEVYFELVAAEQIEKYGRVLDPDDFAAKASDPGTSLGKIAKQYTEKLLKRR